MCVEKFFKKVKFFDFPDFFFVSSKIKYNYQVKKKSLEKFKNPDFLFYKNYKILWNITKFYKIVFKRVDFNIKIYRWNVNFVTKYSLQNHL